MLNSYTKSKLADRDISHIVMRSLEDFGEQQTDKYMNGLEEILNFLADNPNRGRVFTHDTTKRSYFFYRYISHVVYYRQRKNDIFITRILHSKMLPEKHL
ncbi:MAG: plasmid stabilization protein [Bacteroidetes bacterium]|nr:MAG: plasmid stabilization protein [Bacteroidota bacterium]